MEKSSPKLRIKWNFELTVFELAVPDLYSCFAVVKNTTLQQRSEVEQAIKIIFIINIKIGNGLTFYCLVDLFVEQLHCESMHMYGFNCCEV